MASARALDQGSDRRMKTLPTSRIHRIVLALLTLALLGITGSGCHTANGFGKDMEKAGEKIQDGTK